MTERSPATIVPILLFCARRLTQLLLLLVLVTAATSLLSSLIPGDYFSIHELDPAIGKETIRHLREKYGLDRPAVVQYGHWLRNLLSLDLGFSLFYQTSVSGIVFSALGKTLWLALPSLLIGFGLGVLLGTAHAALRNHPAGVLLDVMSTVFLSLPSLLLGLSALLLAERTGWFPLGSMSSLADAETGWWTWLADRIHHMALPVACLSIPIMATVERIQHTAAQQTLSEPFLRTARARGLRPIRLFFQHLMRPSLNSVISTSGPIFGAVLSGSLVLEVIFAWPGLGRVTYDALFNRDIFLLQGSVVVSTILLVMGNMAADALLVKLDPRVRNRGAF